MRGRRLGLAALLLREGVAVARSQPVASTVAALVVGAVCAVILATTGQAAATEARVLRSIDDVGIRTVVVRDPTGQAGIDPLSVEAVERLPGVDWAIGFGPVDDVRNAALDQAGNPVPSRLFFGSLPPPVELGERTPVPGQAVAGSDALASLGAAQPALGVTGSAGGAAVVGGFRAEAPLEFLDDNVLVAPERGRPNETALSVTLDELYVQAEAVEDVEVLARAIPAVLRSRSTQYLVESPAELVQLRNVVRSDLGASARQLMLGVLAAGLLLVALTLVGAVSQRRRDFGRRRALGASRSTVVALVLVQTVVAAVVGVAAGVVAGLVLVNRLAGSLPSPAFTAGVVVLAVLAALLAAVPPAVLAAYRDPVRILRVP